MVRKLHTGKRCSVCGNSERDYSLHRFPCLKYKDVYDKWIESLNLPELRELPHDLIRRKYRVCEKHFRRSDYYVSKDTRFLKKNSVPVLDPSEIVKSGDEPYPARKDRADSDLSCTPKSVRNRALMEKFYTGPGINNCTIVLTDTLSTPLEEIMEKPSLKEAFIIPDDVNCLQHLNENCMEIAKSIDVVITPDVIIYR